MQMVESATTVVSVRGWERWLDEIGGWIKSVAGRAAQLLGCKDSGLDNSFMLNQMPSSLNAIELIAPTYQNSFFQAHSICLI